MFGHLVANTQHVCSVTEFAAMLDNRLLLFALISFVPDIGAVIRPSATLSIINGEGFITYLEVPKNFGVIKNCWFRIRDENKVKIDLNTTNPIIIEHTGSVLPFSPTVCGIRVNKLSTAAAAIWTLEAENDFGDFEQDHVTVNILPPQKTRFETHVQREIGDGTIACSKHDSYTKHCKIIADNGEITNACDLYTTIRPNRTFECLMYNWGRLEESHEFIFVDIKEGNVYSQATTEETDTSIILRCQFKDTPYSCQAEMPDHKNEIYIMDGLYNGRYSAYDTNVKQSKCALEIPKPLKENEIGLWRFINYDKSLSSGCLFYVGKSKSDIIEEELKTIDKRHTIKLYQPETDSQKTIPEIACIVPYAISDCYLKDPNNTVHFPDAYKIQRQGQFGKCEFANVPIIAGIWTCGARGRDYDKEVLQEIEVRVESRQGRVITPELKGRRGITLELMCVSAFEDPLSHCAYIDPLDRVHLVGTSNSIKTAGHVQYYGRGLQFGECGAKIVNYNVDDFGEWRCQFLRYSNRAVSIFKMQLRESATAHATSIGLGVGISVMIILVLGVIVGTIFYRRRNMTARHDFHSADPLEIPNVETST